MGTHDRIEWEVLRRIFGGCAKCGTPGYAERDHIVPLYQGGSDSLENIQPLCSLCNSRKGPETIDWRPHTHPQWREHFAAVFALMDKPR